MYSRRIRLFTCAVVIVICFMPIIIHFNSDMILGVQIEYLNYYPDIYIFNCSIFVYYFVNNFIKMHLSNKIATVLFFVFLINYFSSTIIYISGYIKLSNAFLDEKVFGFLVVITVLNIIAVLIMEITSCEKDTDWHYSEDKYDKYTENRYERYLLKRIDEKLNSIKKSESEKKEEKNNDIINAKELMNGSDILAEMLRNHIELKEYFKISKNQSKFSFYFSIVSSVVGIIVVIIAAFGIVIYKNLEISIFAAVSGAITEIISGVVLWIHNKSALQLNYYYDSLHENEKFLSAVNIADKLSEEKKEDMYIEIIRKQIDIQLNDKENKAFNTGKE